MRDYVVRTSCRGRRCSCLKKGSAVLCEPKVVRSAFIARCYGPLSRSEQAKLRTSPYDREAGGNSIETDIASSRPPERCVHHADSGNQYCSEDYREVLSDHDFIVSISRKGNCWDNAATESFFKTLKAELLWQHARITRQKVEQLIINNLTVTCPLLSYSISFPSSGNDHFTANVFNQEIRYATISSDLFP